MYFAVDVEEHAEALSSFGKAFCLTPGKTVSVWGIGACNGLGVCQDYGVCHGEARLACKARLMSRRADLRLRGLVGVLGYSPDIHARKFS